MFEFCFAATFEIAEDYPLFQSIYKVDVTDEDIAHGDRLTVGAHYGGDAYISETSTDDKLFKM